MNLPETTVVLLIVLESAGLILLGGMFAIALLAGRRMKKKLDEAETKTQALSAELKKFLKAVSDLA